MNKKDNPHPKVLIISTSKVNFSDSFGNNLLLRNLFDESWPKENLAQIYSSGNNNDQGYFGKYYKLSHNDRRFGKFFFQNKEKNMAIANNNNYNSNKTSFTSKLKNNILKTLYESGLYELIFKPKVSAEMMKWINDFNPDVIFAQGYLISFCILPIKIKQITDKKLAIFSTDDWPSYLYSGKRGGTKILSWLIRPFVIYYSNKLYRIAEIPFAFGEPMKEVYEKRYNKKFISLNHSDDPERFEKASAKRLVQANKISIVSSGHFNKYRAPQLLDIELACKKIFEDGFDCECTIISDHVDEKYKLILENSEYLRFISDPGNSELPSILKGADILIIVESFDEEYSKSISLSISTKAHLYMFSERPIIIYSNKSTGLYRYSEKYNWAELVAQKDYIALSDAIKSIIKSNNKRMVLAQNSKATVGKFHFKDKNLELFKNSLSNDQSEK